MYTMFIRSARHYWDHIIFYMTLTGAEDPHHVLTPPPDHDMPHPSPPAATYLELIRHVLLIEGIEADKLKAFCHHVEQLVVSLGAHRHLVRPDLQTHIMLVQAAAFTFHPFSH